MMWPWQKETPKQKVVFAVGERDGNAILNARRMISTVDFSTVDFVPRVGETVLGLSGYTNKIRGTVLWVIHDYRDGGSIEVGVGLE